MNTDSKIIYRQIEQQRNKLINELKLLNKECLYERLKEGGWNILEVMGHLLQTEKLALSYVKKKMNVVQKIKYSGIKAFLNKLLLLTVLFMPFRYKAPNNSMPEDHKTLEELENEWAGVRKELLGLLDETGNESQKLLYRHPFAGRMNLIQMMQFFKAHIRHHIKQIYRIQKGFKQKI